MGTQGGPNIEEDGVVFYVDAANPKSYISGDTTCNSLVSSNIGTIINTGPTDDFWDPNNSGSWIFDGTDDYIDCGGISALNAASNLSLSFWCKKATGDNLGAEAFNTTTNKVILYWWTNDTVYWGVRNTGSPLAAAFVLADFGNWHHFTGTYEGSSGTIKLYVDGSFVDTKTGAPAAITDLSSYFKIAKANGTSFGTGQISNVQIYNKTLTAAEVTHNYNVTKSRFGL